MIITRCTACDVHTACARLYPDWLCRACIEWALRTLLEGL